MKKNQEKLTKDERSPLLNRLPDDDICDYKTNLDEDYSRNPTTSILVPVDDIDEEDYHCHTKAYKHETNWAARRTLVIASIICLLFMVAEIVGGLLAGSLAIITDAAHLLTDFASFLISLFSLFVASRPASRRMSFGWHRAEVLGAFISVFLIWIVTGILVYIAIERIINKNYDIDARIMLITAAIGVSVNIIMGMLLHFCGDGHGHSHGGGHSHAPEKKPDPSATTGLNAKTTKKNINVRAAFIHVLGDLVQSVGVFIAALVIFYHPDLVIIDPICTFIFSVLVLITTLAIMRDAVNVLMEGIPRGIDFSEVVESLESIDGVQKVHDLRIWALTMDKVALSVHLAIENRANAQEVLRASNYMLRKNYGVFESTVQIELYSESMKDCTKCEQPK